jgi:proline racemase
VTELVLEAPAGLIRIRCTCHDGKVTSVEFENQPAFAYCLDAPMELEGYPTLTVDVARGRHGIPVGAGVRTRHRTNP